MKRIILSPAFQSEGRAFLQLAIPLASAQVAQALTGFVDTLMMGRLGEISLAAGGLAVMIFMTFLMTGIGILSSVSALAAAAQGARLPKQVGQIARQGMWLAFLLAAMGWCILSQLNTLLTNLGQDPAVVTLAGDYLQVMRWGLFPGLEFAVLRGIVTALAQARPIFGIMLTANVLNIIGNWIFGFGNLGFPAMGLAGLALASTLAQGTLFLGLLGFVVWQRHRQFAPQQLFTRWHRLQPNILGQLLRLGMPVGVVTILENGLFTVMTLMIGAIGTHALAAQQLALQTIIIVFMVPLGMSYAATARVGYWYGQRDWEGIRRAAGVSIGLTIAVMFLSGVVFALFPNTLIGLYLNVNDPAHQAVVQTGAAMLVVAGFGQVVDGVQRTANGILQGLQDTRVPMLLSVIAYWVIGILSGYWLGFHTPLGGIGIWIGAYLGLAFAAVSYLWRFRIILNRLIQSNTVTTNQQG